MITTLKLLLDFSSNFRSGIILCRARILESNGDSTGAYQLLIKSKNRFEGKSFRFHLFLGKYYVNFKQDHSQAIEELKKGVIILNKKKNLNEHKKQYLLSYAKYIIVKCLKELGQFNDAENLQIEHEQHSFDLQKVSKSTRSSFPYL